MTYPEELLLGRVQFSLQKGVLQLLSKKRVDYREEFLLGRSTLPTMTKNYPSCAWFLYGVSSCLLHFFSKT